MTLKLTHVIDQNVAVEAVILDLDDAAASPDDVQCKVTDPSSNTATYTLAGSSEVTEIETGRRYRLIFPADEAGTWTVRVEALDASDVVLGADEVTLTITATGIA